jgi:phage protein D
VADLAYQIELGGKAVEDDFYGEVLALTVAENTDTASTLRLRLLIELKDDGSWTYLDDDRLAPFAKVKVSIGYTGGGGLAGALGGLGGGGDSGLEPVFEGYFTAVEVVVGVDPGGNILDLSGMDTSVLLGLEEKVATWPNLADSDIVTQILGKYSVTPNVDSTPTTHQENDVTIVQRATDLQFVRELARKNGLEFYFESPKQGGGANAYFRAPKLDGTPQPDLAVLFGDDSNLVSFSARLSAVRPLNVKAQQLDVKSNSVNLEQVGDTQLDKLGAKDANDLLGGALGALVTPADAPAQMLLLGPPTSDSTELNALAQAARDEAGWLITAKGEVNTEAYQEVLRPHRLVLVKGVGAAFSGAYYVTRVVHELESAGSYTQKFEARRNARDLKGNESFGGSGSSLAIPGV